MYVKNSESEE